MIHDAQVEVTCDGEGCQESIYVELEFIYPDLSGRNGRYAHERRYVNPRIKRAGWTIVEGGKDEDEDDSHYCEECAEKLEGGEEKAR